jgi:hypothetical protein
MLLPSTAWNVTPDGARSRRASKDARCTSTASAWCVTSEWMTASGTLDWPDSALDSQLDVRAASLERKAHWVMKSKRLTLTAPGVSGIGWSIVSAFGDSVDMMILQVAGVVRSEVL